MSHFPWIEDVAMYVEVPGWLAKERPVGPVSTQFRPVLIHLLLKSKLIQNLWNLLELNKI